MNPYSNRFDRIAGDFTARVNAVPGDAWDNPAPCVGWKARDVVRHLAEWVPGFYSHFAGLTLATGPSADDDPVGAWSALRASLGGLFADPAAATREFAGPTGTISVAQSIDMFVTNDVFVHTWDLARATGLDERLDADEVHHMFEGMLPLDEMLRTSGHYGPRVAVPADADEQSQFIAFLGRDPAPAVR